MAEANTVILVHDDEHGFSVVPGAIAVKAGSTIHFRTAGVDGNLSFFFPESRFFSQCEGEVTVKENTPPGSYSYQVYDSESRTFAVGDSHPRVIIYD